MPIILCGERKQVNDSEPRDARDATSYLALMTSSEKLISYGFDEGGGRRIDG